MVGRQAGAVDQFAGHGLEAHGGQMQLVGLATDGLQHLGHGALDLGGLRLDGEIHQNSSRSPSSDAGAGAGLARSASNTWTWRLGSTSAIWRTRPDHGQNWVARG